MRDPNQITLCREYYKSNDEFIKAIGTTIETLARQREVMKVYYDEPRLGIIVIQHESNEPGMTDLYLDWLSEDD